MRFANSNIQTRYIIEARQKYIHDQITREEDAKEEGREEGIEEGIKKVALKLILADQMTDLEISQMTEIDIDKIQKLRVTQK
ncbi:MAG: hypothetical protein COB02_18130 [Candidatus Cloacimonadota bacterium]|nr:MAG: hypothetical protein COB02_18130 [Candidatus Cloacimonadota bacterium]